MVIVYSLFRDSCYMPLFQKLLEYNIHTTILDSTYSKHLFILRLSMENMQGATH